MEAGWADERPNDHDHRGLSRLPPCSHCGHEQHFSLIVPCEELVDDELCPCRGVPVPGVYPVPPRISRFKRE